MDYENKIIYINDRQSSLGDRLCLCGFQFKLFLSS